MYTVVYETGDEGQREIARGFAVICESNRGRAEVVDSESVGTLLDEHGVYALPVAISDSEVLDKNQILERLEEDSWR